ncbi:MAG TPA: SPFH domain-containing protein [Bacteroidota bacterium]|nr:SPFH domain-containing protein [Bacteroidota bacterium]
MQTVTETSARRMNGYLFLVAQFVLVALNAYLIYWIALNEEVQGLWVEIPLFLYTVLHMVGFFVVQPNEGRVLVLFGKYIGSVRDSGFHWANPFAIKKHISLRIRNFNSEKIKVNDKHGNPIEIAAVVVWRVVDTSRALFDVEDFEEFVGIQSETAIRGLATSYPYDSQTEEVASLRGNPQLIAEQLQKELQTRLQVAGVEVTESRISHLAYAPEIAQAMLRRQQAQAIIDARKKIVEGAVGMVDDALRLLSEHHIVELDEEKKATMVNNLMVALVSETQAQPIINTGTLYS